MQEFTHCVLGEDGGCRAGLSLDLFPLLILSVCGLLRFVFDNCAAVAGSILWITGRTNHLMLGFSWW